MNKARSRKDLAGMGDSRGRGVHHSGGFRVQLFARLGLTSCTKAFTT